MLTAFFRMLTILFLHPLMSQSSAPHFTVMKSDGVQAFTYCLLYLFVSRSHNTGTFDDSEDGIVKALRTHGRSAVHNSGWFDCYLKKNKTVTNSFQNR